MDVFARGGNKICPRRLELKTAGRRERLLRFSAINERSIPPAPYRLRQRLTGLLRRTPGVSEWSKVVPIRIYDLPQSTFKHDSGFLYAPSWQGERHASNRIYVHKFRPQLLHKWWISLRVHWGNRQGKNVIRRAKMICWYNFGRYCN